MHPRASELLDSLGLRPHPEGGHFVQLFRSSNRVEVLDRQVERSALTTIYFLLAAGELSRWHRVVSDEVWHYYEGDAIELILFDDQGLRRVRLGPVSRETRPTVVVPAGTWQASNIFVFLSLLSPASGAIALVILSPEGAKDLLFGGNQSRSFASRACRALRSG